MPTPRVSIIMPTYNRVAYLGEAIGSVLSQTWTDFELLVVDDGSTDETAAVLANVVDPRVRVLRRDHRGVSATVNSGLREARGEYVSRLDSDDVWMPEALQVLVGVLDHRPEVGVVYAKGQAMDVAGRPLPYTNGLPLRFPGESLRSLVYEDFTCNIATLARRSCFDRAGEYDESLPANEDWDMWLRIAEHDQFAFVERVLARFRWHEGNMTGPASPLFRATLETRTRPLDKVFARPARPAAVIAMKATAYENVYLFRCLRWLHARDIGSSWRELRRALGVSENRPRTIVRTAWFILISELLGRSAVGRRFADGLSAARHRWLRRGQPQCR